MAKTGEKGVSIDILGTCTTNTKENSQHDAKVEYRHLWSYAQQAALIAVSDKNEQDGCYHLITDPERRARRIAAHYAYLYFESSRKSGRKVEFYWPALAAFVVKDIVEAYRFAREDVLQHDCKGRGSSVRNSVAAEFGSVLMTNDSPYQHAIRTYSAFAKGNLWLFMDIYPWLWFFLEYGINADGSLNKARLNASLSERSWSTFQKASKESIEELPFGPRWMNRFATRLANDPVYKMAQRYFTVAPVWAEDGGYGQRTVNAYQAHQYCRSHVKQHDNGYRVPLSEYWGKFKEAYFVMESEHVELKRMSEDSHALAVVEKIREFSVTGAVSKSYGFLIQEHGSLNSDKKTSLQQSELVAIAEQEQVNVLQPLIYDDPLLKVTMDTNHHFSRLTNGWLSPKFKVIYSARFENSDPESETVFDRADSTAQRVFGKRQSLAVTEDRMKFVQRIATDFHRLMKRKRSYMDAELKKILCWRNA